MLFKTTEGQVKRRRRKEDEIGKDRKEHGKRELRGAVCCVCFVCCVRVFILVSLAGHVSLVFFLSSCVLCPRASLLSNCCFFSMASVSKPHQPNRLCCSSERQEGRGGGGGGGVFERVRDVKVYGVDWFAHINLSSKNTPLDGRTHLAPKADTSTCV